MASMLDRVLGRWRRTSRRCPECDANVTSAQAVCDVCGYDLVQLSRDHRHEEGRPPVA